MKEVKNNEKKKKTNISGIYSAFINEYYSTTYHNWKQLRYCSADVGYTEHYYFLRSYSTIVAFITRNTGICYDILRAVYGYTSTSCQHIAKFKHDYNAVDTVRIDEHEQLIDHYS